MDLALSEPREQTSASWQRSFGGTGVSRREAPHGRHGLSADVWSGDPGLARMVNIILVPPPLP